MYKHKGKLCLDRFEVANMACKIDGYMMPPIRESQEKCFENAREELKNHFEQELERLKLITLEQYLSSKKKDFK